MADALAKASARQIKLLRRYRKITRHRQQIQAGRPGWAQCLDICIRAAESAVRGINWVDNSFSYDAMTKDSRVHLTSIRRSCLGVNIWIAAIQGRAKAHMANVMSIQP
jgi:hypothetical protein